MTRSSFPEQLALGLAARDRAAAKHEQEIQQLVPIAVELARKAGDQGITVANLRIAADQRGLLPKSEGRRLSWLGAVLGRAGLVPKVPEEWRRSGLAKSHGNLNRVVVLAEQQRRSA